MTTHRWARTTLCALLFVVGAGCRCGPPKITSHDAGNVCADGGCEATDSGFDAGSCTQDTDCPEGTVCLRSAGICVQQEVFDGGEIDAGQLGSCIDGDTRPCGQSKLGECRLGIQTCAGTVWGDCVGEVDPVSETCDGKDNDCDGLVDEDYNKREDIHNCGSCGHECSYPFATPLCVNGDCQMGPCDPGHVDLNHDPSDGCEYACTVSNGGTEICDGIDNDCNGVVDENQGPLTCGFGECKRTVPSCVNGIPQTCTPGQPSEEVCDGKDNDCNGQTDENLQPISCGKGECARTVEACVSGVPQTCVPGTPTTEVCDGKDNNCDGVVDEGCACIDNTTQSCYSGPTGTSGKGVCHGGTQTCTGGQWGPCNNEVVPSQEVCDGLDNDCNGTADDGLGTTTCGQGECKVTVNNCQNGVTQTCTPKSPTAEVCDGKDNDCNGQIDDGLGTKTCGKGACTVTVQACLNGVAQTCTPGTPTTEVCDGIDNDCDGLTDETFPQQNQSCSTGLKGPCGTGVYACSGGGLSCTQTVFPKASETCNNGIDDDCNGIVDDPTQCGCNTSIDRDLDGYNECVDCNDRDGTIHPNATERCNGKDDNCNGAIDEGFDKDNDGFTTCGTLPGGGVDPTRIDCNDNNAFVYPGKATDCGNAATPTSPNGVDDNCNGYVDETCNCSNTDKDGDGVTPCQGDCNDSDPNIFPGKTEVCDGKDNDCNKATVDNCGVSDPCGYKSGNSYVPYPTGTDTCKPDLLCVSSVATGELTCGSLCNQTTGLGLGDSCASNEGCNRDLIDGDDLHLCSKTTVGGGAAGANCSLNSDCRSAQCTTEGTKKYCSDLCTHENGCTSTTTCSLSKNPLTSGPFIIGYYYSGFCRLDTLITGTKTTGQTCTVGSSDCKAGVEACFKGVCTQPCCSNADCASGFNCSINGPSISTGYKDSSNRPIYSMVPSCLASTASKTSGQSCAASSECKSGICEKTLGVCVDVCCNDTTCPNGTTCEPIPYVNSQGQVEDLGRFCVFSPAPTVIEQK